MKFGQSPGIFMVQTSCIAAYVGYLKYPNNKPLPTLAITQCDWGDGSSPTQTGSSWLYQHLVIIHFYSIHSVYIKYRYTVCSLISQAKIYKKIIFLNQPSIHDLGQTAGYDLYFNCWIIQGDSYQNCRQKVVFTLSVINCEWSFLLPWDINFAISLTLIPIAVKSCPPESCAYLKYF